MPGLVGKLAKHQGDEPLRDEQGKLVLDGNQKPITVSAAKTMLGNLIAFRNATATVIPDGAEVNWMEVHGDGSAFRSAIEMLSLQIVKGILFQTLATSEGVHQARASSESHAAVLDMLISWFKGLIASMIRYDILLPLLTLNYGAEYAKKYLPIVSLGDSDRRHWSTEARAAAALAPFLTESQRDNLFTSIGITPRLEGEEYPTRAAAVPPPPDLEDRQKAA